jgi:TPR repeat protein
MKSFINLWLALFLSYHWFIAQRSVSEISAIKIETLDLDLGVEKGIKENSIISSEVLGKILQGVESGNKDNIYFYGLLKLYGISMTKDPKGAGQQFLRAANLGHTEAISAYGVMLLTGAFGQPDFEEAVKYFREGAAKGDMVRSYVVS